ncbi:cadherin domain-containing protein [Haloferula sargassicola]|uniref:PA14 domain-containing protein n=1 Tax=Haloferula sargassicola TaxID=490096 RepID=A0ABP9UM68_9BACT
MPTLSTTSGSNDPAPLAVSEKWLDEMVDAEGGKVRFALPGGGEATGSIDLIERTPDGGVLLVQGRLAAPRAGFFAFNRQTMPGVAGAFFGHARFDEGNLAYRVEPIGPDGAPMLVQRRRDQVICVGLPPMDAENPAKAQAAKGSADPQYAPQTHPTDIPIPGSQNGIVPLQSKPGALGVIFLDFEGGPGPWYGWGDFYAQPANVSNDQIKEVWQRVSEDFQPFNVNITTDRAAFLAAPLNSRQRVMVTPTNNPAPGAGGVAAYWSFNSTSDQVCWAFYTSGKGSAEVISHEVGHTLGLSHDGDTGSEYHGGFGTDPVGWAPIMGAGYYKNLTQWSKGEYNAPSNTEDDLAIITNNNNTIDFRDDDYGTTFASAGYLEVMADGSVSNEGIIEVRTDVDAFRFTSTGGTVTLTVNPVAQGPNLDILAEIYTSSNVLVASDNPDMDVKATVSANLAAGDYTLRVSGVGRGNPLEDGYTDYACLGAYLITGSANDTVKPDRFTIQENVPLNTTVGTIVPRKAHGGNSLAYTISGGNPAGAFAIHPSTGSLRVANASAIDYEALSTQWDDPATIELFVTITDAANPSLNETIRVVVTVQDLNEAPQIVGGPIIAFSRTRPGAEILDLQGTDPDRFDFITYSIAGGNDDGVFGIDPTTGSLHFEKLLDLETEASFPLTLRASDQREPVLHTDVGVTVTVKPPAGVYVPGGIPRTYYHDITGGGLSALTGAAKFPDNPDAEEALYAFDGGDHGNDYGSTVRGFLIPPVTGAYTFWIASDDASELRISTNSNPAGASVRASVNSWTDRYEFDQDASQKSAAINLTAGKAYFIEARHKEGSGGDHVAVAWQGPGISREVIPGRFLAPCSPVNRAPGVRNITLQVRGNAVTGATVGTVEVSDFNPLDRHTFRPVRGSGFPLFDVDPATGRIFVKDAAALEAAALGSYELVVEASDDGYPSRSGQGSITLNLIEASSIAVDGIVRQTWRGVDGGIAQLLNHPGYPYHPDLSQTLDSFDAGSQNFEFYGSRIRAYLVPPTSGNYRFYISSDDQSTLELSTSSNPNAATQIASVNSWTDPHVYDKEANQTSAERSLIGGRRYYIEVRHFQGVGGDNLSVAWTGPGISTPTVIPGSALDPFNINELPTWNGTSTFSAVAGSRSGTFVGTCTAVDPEGEAVNYSIRSGNDAFAIDPATGEITVADGAALVPGRDEALLVNAQDGGLGGVYPLQSRNLSVIIHVPADAYAMRVRHDAYTGSTIGTLVTPSSGNTFQVTGGSGAALFDIEAGTGRVKVKDHAALSAAPLASRTLVVSTSLDGTITVTIEILDAGFTDIAGVVRDVFTDYGATLADLPSDPRFPDHPTYSRVLGSLDAGSENRDQLATRIRGYIVPPVTGAYRFYISSDDESSLMMSTSENPAAATQIAEVESWVGPRSWTDKPSQESSTRVLVAGQRYYFEVRHHEGWGDDDLAVAWTTPDIPSPVVVPGSAIQPFNVNDSPQWSAGASAFSASYGADPGTSVGSIAASDPEGDSLCYAILSGNSAGAFAIDSTTGEITVANGTALPGGEIASLTVGVQDAGIDGVYPLRSVTRTVSIQILSSIEGWRQQQFGTDAGNPTVAGNDADPDHDSIPNLVEYALGLDPLAPDAAVGTVDLNSIDSDRYFRLTVSKNPEATDVTVAIEGSHDLGGSWSTEATTIEVNTSILLRARLSTPIGSGAPGFLRVKVTEP